MSTQETPSRPRRKTRGSTARRQGSQVSAASTKLRFDEDDRPALSSFNMPGPRRDREGRGGAQASLEVLRYLIRCPLLPALASAVAPRVGGGRPSAYPAIFWIFYTAAIRELRSEEQLCAELSLHWREIAKEFYFEHDVALPTEPGVAPASFNSWRTNNLIDRRQQIDVLLDRFTQISASLALAIRSAEGWKATEDLLNPTLWDIIAADGTVINAPSDVRPELTLDDSGAFKVTYRGSRADPSYPERARTHETQRKVSKRSGSPEGLYNIAVTTKGTAKYTRTVLAVNIAPAEEGENPLAMRALRRTYDHLGSAFPVLVYDGAITPKHAQELTAEYGTFTVNANHARSKDRSPTRGKGNDGAGESTRKDFPANSDVSGEGVSKFGHTRGHLKRTYVTALPEVTCPAGHAIHVVADDGAVYRVDQPATRGGTSRRLELMAAIGLERRHDERHGYYFRITLSGTCHCKRNVTTTFDLSRDGATGPLSWRERPANIRIIPEVAKQYARTMGHRNQAESFFSWLKQRYYRKNRAASWGRPAQIVDLLGAALLHNAEAWAHLAYRHPEAAVELGETLASLPLPDLSGVVRKPVDERKKAVRQRQRFEAVNALLEVATEALDPAT